MGIGLFTCAVCFVAGLLDEHSHAVASAAAGTCFFDVVPVFGMPEYCERVAVVAAEQKYQRETRPGNRGFFFLSPFRFVCSRSSCGLRCSCCRTCLLDFSGIFRMPQCVSPVFCDHVLFAVCSIFSVAFYVDVCHGLCVCLLPACLSGCDGKPYCPEECDVLRWLPV